MWKMTLCLLLSLCLLDLTSLAQATSKSDKLKSKVINWGLQKNVTVRLTSGETVEGRIAEITDAYFAVQGVSAGQVTTRKVNFSEVHRISGKGETDVRKIAQYVSLGTGVLFAVLAVVSFSKSNNRPRTIVFQ
jgi:hypothetical protein